MSGGSWDYAYLKLEDWADALVNSNVPLRQAAGRKMKLLASAMQDIEWVDSGDMGPGDERTAIRAFLGDSAAKLELQEIIGQAEAVRETLAETIAEAKADL